MSNVGLSTAQGALGGAGTGAAIGTALLPGVGTVLGTIGGGIIGALSGSDKASELEKVLKNINSIPLVDPKMVELRDSLSAEKKAIESGFSTDFQVARDMIAESEAGGMSVAAEIAATNPALGLMAMNQVSSQADASVNKALGTIGTRSTAFTQMLADLMGKMSQRELDITMFKNSQNLAIAFKNMKDFNENSMAGMMQLLDPEVISGFKSVIGSGGVDGGKVAGLLPFGWGTNPADFRGSSMGDYFSNMGIGIPQ